MHVFQVPKAPKKYLIAVIVCSFFLFSCNLCAVIWYGSIWQKIIQAFYCFLQTRDISALMVGKPLFSKQLRNNGLRFKLHSM